MAELRLRQELEDSKAEITRLRERLVTTLPTVNKDLSLISIVPKWSGAETDTTVDEFLASIEGAAKIARWDGADCLQIATFRLLDPAKAFCNSYCELQAENTTWERFKAAFRDRFKDAHADQYHLLNLHTAKQAKGEGPQEFADRCKNVSRKVMRRVNDPMAQQIHQENADRMCLATYVSGLSRNIGKWVRIQNPQTMQQALTIALAATEAERKDKGSEIFFTRNNKPSNQADQTKRNGERASDTRERRDKISGSAKGRSRNGTDVKCYECNGYGHFGRECATRLKRREGPQRPSGKTDREGRATRSDVPRTKTGYANKSNGNGETRGQGNE